MGCKNVHPVFPEREEGAYWEFGSEGGVASPLTHTYTYTYTLHPSIPTLQVEASEKEGCVRWRSSWGGVWVLDRAGEGRWWGVLGLNRGWSHTCTASPRSRWSTACTGAAMRTPLARNELYAPSSPPARWGIACSIRPSPAPGPPGQRAACTNVCSLCQKSTRNRTRSGLQNRCLDLWLRARQGKSIPPLMAKVQIKESLQFFGFVLFFLERRKNKNNKWLLVCTRKLFIL